MYNSDVHNRQSIRLRDFDYAAAGAYYVTLCAWQRECLFGGVADGAVWLNEFGEVVRNEWLRTPQVRPNVVLDGFVLMPNHLHAILWIVPPVGAHRCAPECGVVPDRTRAHGSALLRREPGSLGSIVAGFKSAATKRINFLRNNAGCPVWQRNYYEHVNHGDRDLHAIRRYIADNPAQWELDTYHPTRI